MPAGGDARRCRRCSLALPAGARFCPLCGEGIAGPGVGRLVRGPTLLDHNALVRHGPRLFYRFLFLFVLFYFAISLLLSLDLASFPTYLLPHPWSMAGIKWLFAGLLVAAAATLLHEACSRPALALSFVPSAVMLTGLSHGLVSVDGAWELVALALLFLSTAAAVYLDFSLWLDYPAEGGLDIDECDVLVLEGRLQMAEGKMDRALEAFDAAIELDPGNTEAWRYRGEALVRGSRYADALKSFKRAIATDPERAGAYYDMAVLLNFLGQKREAFKALNGALNRDGGHRAAWLLAGDILFEQEKHSDALRFYDNALALDRKDAETWRKRGEIILAMAVSGGAESQDIERGLIDSTLGLGSAEAVVVEPGLELPPMGPDLGAEAMAAPGAPVKTPPRLSAAVDATREEVEERAEAEVEAMLTGEREIEQVQGEPGEEEIEAMLMEGLDVDAPVEEELEPVKRRKQRTLRGEEEPEDTGMRCPICETAILRGDKNCRECGARIAYHCPSCDAELSPSDERCYVCGMELE